MESMTGFGRGDDDGLVVEVRGVNARALEVKARLPRELVFLEAALLEAVRKEIGRGRVDVVVILAEAGRTDRGARVDAAALCALLDELQAAVKGRSDVDARLTLGDLVRAPHLFKGDDAPVDEERAQASALRALAGALAGFRASRLTEGGLLKSVVTGSLDRMATLVDELRARTDGHAARMHERLSDRVQRLLGEAALDPGRVAQEVAILADRADVTEELARLGAHLTHLRGLLDDEGPIGRKLDFMCQELHREANTCGSKSSDAETARLVVDLKAEIERLREQAQNIV